MIELLEELRLVSSKAPFGSHKEVAELLGISTSLCNAVRDGDRWDKDTAENREKIKNMISEYRGAVKRELESLSEIDVTDPKVIKG